MRGADIIAKTLSNAGVEVIFTLSGNQIMPIFDACIDVDIRLVHTRHEGAAVYMAEAYAQLTGKVGVAMITAAPGFASGLGPLYTAAMGENPIILLSGDSPRTMDGKGAFQELDQVSISKPLTKLSLRPDRAEDLGADVAEALRVAQSGRPGPVHLALPFDLLNTNVNDVAIPSALDLAVKPVEPSSDAVAAIVDAVAAGERPVVLVGPLNNPTRARGLLEQLSDTVGVPVIPMESPRGLSDPCLGDVAKILREADVVVSIGKNIDFTTGFGKTPAMSADCRFLIIDPEADVLDRAARAMGARLVMSHQADATVAVRALIAAGQSGQPVGHNHAAWRAEVTSAIATRPMEPATSGDGPMRPATLCAAVQRFLDAADDPILIVDGGEVGQWGQAFISAPTRMINGPSGAIGGCLCYAVAAKIARPNATVVVFMGDGTVGFHFAEFETAHRYGADFVAVVGHDARWNAEYQIQLREYGTDRLNECELNPTRYDLAAAGFGCHGEHVSDAADLDAAFKRAGESGLPTCLIAEIEGLPAPSGSSH